MQSSYITSAAKAQQLPELDAPEIAFVGRSNCGKSSLLNALTQRRGLARTSSTPGRTQMVNFFAVDFKEKRVILADLPGFGFSASGREVRQHWQALISAYLKRRALTRVLFLIDIRRADPPGAEDIKLLASLCESRVPVTIVMTKADKLSASAAKAQIKVFREYLDEAEVAAEDIMLVSVLKKKGITELQESLGLVP